MGSDVVEYTRGRWNDHLIRNGIDQDEVVPLAPLKRLEQIHGRQVGWSQAIRDAERVNALADRVIADVDDAIDGGSPSGASSGVDELGRAVRTLYGSINAAGGSNEEKQALLGNTGLARKLGALTSERIRRVLGLDDE